MRSHWTFCATLMLAAAVSKPIAGQDAVPGEFVILLKGSEKAATVKISDIAPNGRDAEIIRRFASINAVAVKVPVEETVATSSQLSFLAASTLKSDVALIEPNYKYYRAAGQSAAAEGNVDELKKLWYLTQISAKEAWQVRNESPDVIVAVIDTGVFLKHEDLEDNLWVNDKEQQGGNGIDDDQNGIVDDVHGADFFNRSGDDPTGDPSPDVIPAPSDESPFVPHPTKKEFEAHGTHVAGTIGAAENAKGIVGITRKVKIMPLKFLGGFEGSGSLMHAVEAIDYAIRNGARIINASWGGGGRSEILRLAIERANSAGILFVAAAGNGDIFGNGLNNDVTPHFPSSYNVGNIIAVAASEKVDNLTSFSNFGNSVHLAAPGFDIVSTVPEGASDPAQSGYQSFNGTSMATPIVSASAALLMQHNPLLSHLAVKNLILRTVDPVDALAGRVRTGGRLNLLNALTPQLPNEATDLVAATSQQPNEIIGALADTSQDGEASATVAKPILMSRASYYLRPRAAEKFEEETAEAP